MTRAGQGAGVVLGQVLARADEQPADRPRAVRRRVLAEPAPAGAVGVVLHDVDDVLVSGPPRACSRRPGTARP